MIIEDIPYFAEFVALTITLGFSYGFAKLWLSHSKEKSKTKRSDQKKMDNPNIENEMDKWLNSLPQIIQHLEVEIMNLKEKGATNEQTKSLEDKLSMAKKAQQLEPIIKIVGKPFLKKAMSIIDRV
tara:strand:+ start:340 stop:717 length:378 start_codon:yes stop_codon:yes gene_type:complete